MERQFQQEANNKTNCKCNGKRSGGCGNLYKSILDNSGLPRRVSGEKLILGLPILPVHFAKTGPIYPAQPALCYGLFRHRIEDPCDCIWQVSY